MFYKQADTSFLTCCPSVYCLLSKLETFLNSINELQHRSPLVPNTPESASVDRKLTYHVSSHVRVGANRGSFLYFLSVPTARCVSEILAVRFTVREFSSTLLCIYQLRITFPLV